MAMADYYLCDRCGQKALYDADIYDRWEDVVVSILCKSCGETHTLEVVERIPLEGTADET